MEQYERRIALCAWNKDLAVPILATTHGTELAIAEKIAETGFASISAMDLGLYGKGIYFSTHAKYTLLNSAKNRPAIIISYAVPGNV